MTKGVWAVHLDEEFTGFSDGLGLLHEFELGNRDTAGVEAAVQAAKGDLDQSIDGVCSSSSQNQRANIQTTELIKATG